VKLLEEVSFAITMEQFLFAFTFGLGRCLITHAMLWDIFLDTKLVRRL
jgi:hypothetical protein